MRTAQVRRDVKSWLEDDDEIQSFIDADGIRPMAVGPDESTNPQLSLGVNHDSTQRNNTGERTTYNVRIITSGSFAWAKSPVEDGEDPRIDQLEQLRDRVVTVLTTKRKGWIDPRVTSDGEILPLEQVNSYAGETVITAERTDRHPYDD